MSDNLEALGVFPKEDQHIVDLAAETLQEALSDYLQNSLIRSKE